jgi:hypothetical protein
VAPGVVEIQLKDGKSMNITCPPGFGADFATLIKKGDKQDIREMGKACKEADFDTVEGCDSCLTKLLGAAFGQRFEGYTAETYESKGVFTEVPFDKISLINFSNGCPWAQACAADMVASIDDKDLAAKFEEMLTKCDGPKPGPDYTNAFAEIQKIFAIAGVPVGPGGAGGPGGPGGVGGVGGDGPTDVPAAGATPDAGPEAVADVVASLATGPWAQSMAAIAIVAMMIV